MLKILEVTAPIHLIIALGFIAVRRQWMETADMRSLGRFVARFGLPARALALLAGRASAASLFVIGGSLVGIRLAGIRSDIALVTFGKLCLHCALVALGVLLLPPHEPALRAAALLFAAMPMMSILAQPHGEEAFSAAVLLTVIVTSFFTIGLVIGVLPAAWIPVR